MAPLPRTVLRRAVGLAVAVTVAGGVLVAAPAAAQAPSPGTAGLVAWYPLDEVGGTTVADRSPAARSATAVDPAGAAVTGEQGLPRAAAASAGTVPPRPTDLGAVQQAAAAIAVPGIDAPRGNLSLPTTGAHGTAIAWRSSRDSVITPTGEVTRPAAGRSATTVVLTATVTRGRFRHVRTFTAQVPPLPAPAPLAGYAFAYFTGEGSPDGEQIYFSASRGNDPLHWQDVNGGRPVLRSVLGEKGLRDPFVIRSPEGDRFFMLATDLRVHGNGDWNRAQRNGSRSIMVWESADLVTWSPQRSVEVSPPNAGNTWAPEAFYDPGRGEYVVYWASKLYADARRTGDTYNRVVAATTRDFHTFGPARPYIDKGYSVIDTTVVADRGAVYRYSKDERSPSPSSPNGKFVFLERGDSVLDPTFELVREGIGKGQIGAGEGPTVFKSNTEQKWYLFIDEFGGRGYVPFETTDLGSGVFTPSTGYALPRSPRHGTVIALTAAEHAALLRVTGR